VTEYLLAIDVGTSALHCLLTDTRGQPLASIQAPISHYTPIDCSTLGREIDPQFSLGTVEGLITSLLRKQRNKMSHTGGLNVDGS
jgi:sugar (pentulose or hexulose) kinase